MIFIDSFFSPVLVTPSEILAGRSAAADLGMAGRGATQSHKLAGFATASRRKRGIRPPNSGARPA